MPRANTPLAPSWNLTAAVAGWLLPGLGHFLLGERKRAWILGCTIIIIWLGGLLISGISVIDRVNHSAWFFGQMLMAPSVAVNFVHEYIDENFAEADQPEVGGYEPSFGHVYEQGMLYTLLAGLLNLLAILDVAYRHPEPRHDSATSEDPPHPNPKVANT